MPFKYEQPSLLHYVPHPSLRAGSPRDWGFYPSPSRSENLLAGYPHPLAPYTVSTQKRATLSNKTCKCEGGRALGPVYTYPEIFASANFFMRIQKYLRPHVSYANRIRSSTRIRLYPADISKDKSTELARKKTGSDTVTSAYTKIYGYERPHVPGYTACTEISTLESVYKNLRIHRAHTADTCGR